MVAQHAERFGSSAPRRQGPGPQGFQPHGAGLRLLRVTPQKQKPRKRRQREAVLSIVLQHAPAFGDRFVQPPQVEQRLGPVVVGRVELRVASEDPVCQVDGLFELMVQQGFRNLLVEHDGFQRVVARELEFRPLGFEFAFQDRDGCPHALAARVVRPTFQELAESLQREDRMVVLPLRVCQHEQRFAVVGFQLDELPANPPVLQGVHFAANAGQHPQHFPTARVLSVKLLQPRVGIRQLAPVNESLDISQLGQQPTDCLSPPSLAASRGDATPPAGPSCSETSCKPPFAPMELPAIANHCVGQQAI